MNNVNLIGRLTKDPELRRTAQGKPVANFTIAINRIGNDNTDFIDCVVWDKQAENLQQYCSKGDQVGVVGRLQTRTYQNNENRTIKVVEVLCNMIEYLQKKATTQSTNALEEEYNKMNIGNIDDIDIDF